VGYFFYERQAIEIGVSFSGRRATALGGTRTGLIVRALRREAVPKASEPWCWHIKLSDVLASLETATTAFVIDLKPANASNVSLYELRDVWGFSYRNPEYQWTPMMLRLRTLLSDESSTRYDKRGFVVHTLDDRSIFTFLYLDGSVDEDGTFVGRWCFPRPSSTNSVLLWPDAFAYFVEQTR
jgi:hypothetical protein